jgi:hypothetical protein
MLSTVVATQRRASVVVARTRGRGARRLGWGAAWRYHIAWGGALGGRQRLEAWFNGEVLSPAGVDGADTRVKLSDRRLGDGQLSMALWHTRLQWSARSRAMVPHACGN